jgi:predicted nuclease of predicted toxin-antitoxin system
VRVLLDENLPHKLRHLIKGHDLQTASYKGWSGVKNGDLLRLAEEDGFELLLTGDRNLMYQQSMTGRRIAIVTLSAQNWLAVQANISKIQAALDTSLPGSFQAVELSRPRRDSQPAPE